MRSTVVVAFLLLAILLGVNATYYLPLSTSQCTSATSCTILNTGLVKDSLGASSASQATLLADGATSTGTVLTMNNDIRLYLVNASGNGYQPFFLMNNEISFTVNTSAITCGGNGALYLTSMPLTGTAYSTGTGYCDAPSGCSEFDLWEANKYATAMTGHPCQGTSCDTNGCQYNPYKQGLTSFYGPSSSYTVNSASPFTVVTQFITDTNTASGNLIQVKRFYIQNGVTTSSYSLSTSYCSGEGNGGLAQMGKALGAGMVLIFSLWDSDNGGLSWLDVTPNGLCSSNSAENFAFAPALGVQFGNIKVGPIGFTTGTTSSSTSTTKSATTTTTSTAKSVTTTTTSTTKASSTSTTGSSTTGSSTSTVSVYSNGAFATGFSSGSWGTFNTKASIPSGSGYTYGFSLEIYDYGGFYAVASTSFSISAHTYISFQIYSNVAATISNKYISILLYSGGSTTGTQGYITVAANTWTTINYPLSSFAVASTTSVSGFVIQGNTAADTGTLYLSTVSLS